MAASMKMPPGNYLRLPDFRVMELFPIQNPAYDPDPAGANSTALSMMIDHCCAML